MIPQAVRMYNPKGPDRRAILSVQLVVGQVDQYHIQLARGTGAGPLDKETVFGPFPQLEVQTHFHDILVTLKSEGFLATGLHDLLANLKKNAVLRARAALGLGWRRADVAVEPILDAAPGAVDEMCSFLDALGAIGDPQAIPLLREQASRKLLSRRRSAVEGLRNLQDEEGLAVARQQALERLPDSVRQLLQSFAEDQAENTAVDQLVQSVLALQVNQRGLALDTLYELASPLTIAVTRAALGQVAFEHANIWRYVKSIYKRATLRHDYVTWGWLSHAIEKTGRASTGTHALVKSGLDGVQRQTRIFSRKTQQFMRRWSWRFLRQLATFRPEAYTRAAAEALIHYAPEDGDNPQGLYGRFASCFLLNRILWSGSNRLVLSDKSLRFRFRNAKDISPRINEREEPYPQLWDAQPWFYLRLLGAALLPEVHAFAVRAVETRHPNMLREADNAELVPLLQAPYEPTVKLGLAELERRFDPQHPNWALLDQLLRDNRSGPRQLGERWLRLTAPRWTKNLEQILYWLKSPHPATRSLTAELTIASLRADPSLREALAKDIFDLVENSKIKDDVADGVVAVAREVLLDDIAPMLSLQQLVGWIGRNSLAILSLAADLLGRRTESVQELGLERLAWLAQHDMAVVRAGAHQFIRKAEAFFRDDISLLLVLAESSWEDTRKLAVELLRGALQSKTLGLDDLLGFLDSNQVEVQNLGQELARVRIASLQVEELIYRLVQHPHLNMRQFALDLVIQHLPDGAEPLAQVERFFRSALFDLWPQRRAKNRVLDFLSERGLRDENQAAVAVRILSDIVRMQSRSDFERALESLVRIKLMYPQTASEVRLVEVGKTT